MVLKNFYWVFHKALSDDTIEKIIKDCDSEPLQKAETFDDKQRGGKNAVMETKADWQDQDYVRYTDIAWVERDWIYDIITPFIHTANRDAEWNVDIDWKETMQYGVYSKDHFYDWHQDSDHPFDDTNPIGLRGKVRKLTIIMLLSDPNTDYEGGELQFDFGPYEPNRYHTVSEGDKGNLIVFPSFLFHRVKPVTSGVRRSLVCWNCGPQWR
tara:strand:+ start:393 stop:1025 length:633 start_codon:yes stop_codon:yes gene_type:complete